jgi:tRNA A-37 threonylcarbamoyl transferase component Bud32
MPGADTICPSCEATGGELAAPCGNPVCRKKGYHFIPAASWHRHVARASSSGARPDPTVGRLVQRYLVTEKIGEGGMGDVYLALQLPVRKQVALKMIQGLMLDEDARRRFEREATSQTMLYHPNIVSLVDYGMDESTGAPFMALEYIKGGRELAELMEERRKRGEAWTGDELIAIFSQILSALAVAHREGLVHRDIKPQNIMLVRVEGNPHFVYLLDFGLARAFGDIPGMETLTAKGAVIGTPQYMAPEQIASRGEVDFRCDLYAVGTVLFEMVAGRAGVSGKSTKEIFFEKLNPDFDPLSLLAPGKVPAPLSDFFRRAMARDPAERFASAAAMKRAMIEALGGTVEAEDEGGEAVSGATIASDRRQITGHPATPRPAAGGTQEVRSFGGTEARRPRKKRGPWIGVAAAAVLVLIIGVSYLLGPWSPMTQKHPPPPPGPPPMMLPGPPGPEPPVAAPLVKPPSPVEPAPKEEAKAPPVKKTSEKGAKTGTKKRQRLEPTEEEVRAELVKVEKKVRACIHNAPGTLKGTIGVDGDTGKAHGCFIQGELNTTETRECLLAALKSVSFEPFSKLDFIVPYSFTFEGNPAPAGEPDAATDP